MQKRVIKAGLIGCGTISREYLASSSQFPNFKIVKCADLNSSMAAGRAEEFHITAVDPDQLFADPELEIIINLTPPQAHTALNLKALEAGKHVYCEKVFALNMDDALKVFNTAARKHRLACAAPDSFLGAAQQYARELIDAGTIGKVFGGTAGVMQAVGYISNHPNIDFFFQPGGGPLMDMGAYFFAALCFLLGPAVRVASLGGRLSPERVCTGGTMKGHCIPVRIDTHLQSIVEFASGAVISLNTSFDVRAHSTPFLELYGEKGSLRLPSPSSFGGSVSLYLPENQTWQELEAPYPYKKPSRGLGVSDMTEAILTGRAPRCSADFACHVLEILCAIQQSAHEKKFIELQTTCERPMPLEGKQN